MGPGGNYGVMGGNYGVFFWVMGSIMGPECDLGAPRRQFKVLGAIRGFGGNFMGSQGAIVGLGGQL